MAPLTWQNDTLLLDSEPTPVNEWLTANKLLSKEREGNNSEYSNILTSIEREWFAFRNDNDCSLNLYSILVRKVDFVREKESDRILSRFPFLVLSKEEKELIKKKILLIAEFARDYFYQSINSGIMDWKKRLLTYLNRGAMPYPLFRCSCALLDLTLINPQINELIFESARGKRYAIPTKVTPTIAYLCGVINGDGHLSTHWLRVIDETKEHIELLSELFEKQFNDAGEIFKTRNANAWNVELRSSSAVRLFNFLTDQTIQGAKYDSLREPLIFKELGEPHRNLYWRGVMDADGSYKNHISFSSASKYYTDDFRDFLFIKGIRNKIYQLNNGAYLLTIPIDYKIAFAREIGAMNPKKRLDFIKLIQKKSTIFNGLNYLSITERGFFDFSKISSLYVKGLGFYLKQYRGTKSFSQIEMELGITRGQYSYYEQDKRAVPFSLFVLLCQRQPHIEHYMQELAKIKCSLTYQTSNASAIKLPLKPSKEVIFLMSHLIPLSSWTRILQPSQELRTLAQKIFGINVSGTKIIGNLIKNFLQTFGTYQEIDATRLVKNTLN